MAKMKKSLAQGQNKTTCLPSSNAVSGVHGESLGGEGGDDTDDSTQPPSVAISEGAGVKDLDGLEGRG